MSVVKAVAVFIALAVLSNLVTVAALPRLINAYVMHRIVAQAPVGARRGYNVALPAPRADANARTVVRPSPDLLYTACVFDVSERPLRITAPVQDSYVSVAGFAADTTNFFSINDTAVRPGAGGRKWFDLVLARAGAPDLPAGAQVITAPSDRGLILFRSLITDEADLPRLLEFQTQQECHPH